MNVMSSFNRIGVVWAGAHYGLMTGILRDEWGMEGAAVTDMAMNAKWMDYRMGILAGQDYWCGQKGNMGTLDGSENDPVLTAAVHRSVKNVVYSVTRTHAMNIGNATIVAVTPWWQTALYGTTAVMAVIAIGCMIMAIRTAKKNRGGTDK